MFSANIFFFFYCSAASFSIVERTNPSFSPVRDWDRPPSPDPGLIRVGAPASQGGGSQRSGGCWGWGRGARTRSNGAFEIPNSKAAREKLTRAAQDRQGQNRCDIDDVTLRSGAAARRRYGRAFAWGASSNGGRPAAASPVPSAQRRRRAVVVGGLERARARAAAGGSGQARETTAARDGQEVGPY